MMDSRLENCFQQQSDTYLLMEHGQLLPKISVTLQLDARFGPSVLGAPIINLASQVRCSLIILLKLERFEFSSQFELEKKLWSLDTIDLSSHAEAQIFTPNPPLCNKMLDR